MSYSPIANSRFSRRAFVGGALATSATALMGLAGCAAKDQGASQGTPQAVPGTVSGSSEQAAKTSFLTTPEPVPESDITATKDADVVVVGCGISGMAAARAAADAGAKVIVVENQPIQLPRHHGLSAWKHR